MIPHSEWKWFGSPAHFICALDCRFHMATEIGEYLVSTVGEYLPDSAVREILAKSRGIELEGKGDARRADWMKKYGYEKLGVTGYYETMVFRIRPGSHCKKEDCMCGMPEIIADSLAMDRYDTSGEARQGHLELCDDVARDRIKETE